MTVATRITRWPGQRLQRLPAVVPSVAGWSGRCCFRRGTGQRYTTRTPSRRRFYLDRLMMIASRLCATSWLETVLLASRLIAVRLRVCLRRRPLLKSFQHADARPRALQLDVSLLQLEPCVSVSEFRKRKKRFLTHCTNDMTFISYTWKRRSSFSSRALSNRSDRVSVLFCTSSNLFCRTYKNN